MRRPAKRAQALPVVAATAAGAVAIMCAFCVGLPRAAAAAPGLGGHAPSAELTPHHAATFVPIRVSRSDRAPLRDAVVTMCALDWQAYHADPTRFPLFRDLATHSGCYSRRAPDTVFDTTLGALEDEFTARGCSPVGHFREAAPGCVPTGMVFHEARCGSTLVANMAAVMPWALAYSESSPPMDVMWFSDLPPADIVRGLRVIFAAMGRPIHAAAVHGVTPVAPGATAGVRPNVDVGGGGAVWHPRHMYFKFQSSMTPLLQLLRRAFPETPWVFVHRQPVEVMASLLRNALAPPPPTARVDEHVAVRDKGVREAPCMRHRGPGAPDMVRAMLGVSSPSDLESVPAEDYCAASVAHLCAVALYEAGRARFDAFVGRLFITPPLPQVAGYHEDGYDPMFEDGAAFARWVSTTEVAGELHWHPVTPGKDTAGVGQGVHMLLNATTRRGTVGRIGQAMFIEYGTLPDAMHDVYAYHMGPRPVHVMHAQPWSVGQPMPAAAQVVVDGVGRAEVDAMEATARLYSKARGRTGTVSNADVGGAGSGLRGHPAIDVEGAFVEDGDDKQAKAWPALKAAAVRFLSPLRHLMVAFNVRATGSAVGVVLPTPAPDTAPKRFIPAAQARMLPLGGGYPMTYPLDRILSDWNPDIVTLPATYGQYQTLRVFDYQTEVEEATRYRRAEVPFVIRNVPAVEATVKAWASDETLLEAMGPRRHYMADVNLNNHFMYFHKSKAHRDKDFVPPTTEKSVTMTDWLHLAGKVTPDIMAEEATLPAAWKAPPEMQVPGYGLNAPHVNGDAQAWQQAGPSKLSWSPPVRLGGSEGQVVDGYTPTGIDPPQRPPRELWYLRASSNFQSKADTPWIQAAYPIFDPAHKGFFMVDPQQQRGVHCRFGMPGIIAESHYDQGRNFIAMTRGRKRYILSPPNQCDHLQMLKSGPSARHSKVDWSSAADIPLLRNATALEVVLEAGDILYIPSYWFHFIVSLTVNIQCNARSGTPPHGTQPIADCGFDARFSEAAGVSTDVQTPQHHLIAMGRGLASRAGGSKAGEAEAEEEAGAMWEAGQRMVALARAEAITALDMGDPAAGGGGGGAGVPLGSLRPGGVGDGSLAIGAGLKGMPTTNREPSLGSSTAMAGTTLVVCLLVVGGWWWRRACCGVNGSPGSPTTKAHAWMRSVLAGGGGAMAATVIPSKQWARAGSTGVRGNGMVPAHVMRTTATSVDTSKGDVL